MSLSDVSGRMLISGLEAWDQVHLLVAIEICGVN